MTALIRLFGIVLVLLAFALSGRAQPQPSSESQVILEFQRAVDGYAFKHRQSDRRGAAVNSVEGALFTPLVATTFRSRIAKALATGRCPSPAAGQNFAVPRVNDRVEGGEPAPPCIVAALPRLPDELEYRVAGVALLLVDAHLHQVVDVLHAAF